MRKLIFLLIFITGLVFPQQDKILPKSTLDNLYRRYNDMKKGLSDYNNEEPSENNKCGFGLASAIKRNFQAFTYEQQIALNTLLTRPVTQLTKISNSGFFKVHYDTSGIHKINYSVDDLINAADSAYIYEINYLGFLPPPSDYGAGGDNKYDIYIQNIGSTYGWTDFETTISNNSSTSYITINNDYSSSAFGTHGIDAAKVTIAHEFHHAIQIGNYNINTDETYFFELTSTSMEEFVFPEINDYLYYLKNFFNNPNVTFGSHSGYDLAIWNIYLKSKFDKGIFKKQWEYFRTENSFASISRSISDFGGNFNDELGGFFQACLFTNKRASLQKYFSDAIWFPEIKINMTVLMNNSSKTISGYSEPVAGNYTCILDTVTAKTDTIFLVAVNSNVANAAGWKSNKIYSPYKFNFSRIKETENYSKISPSIYAFFEVTDIQYWKNFSYNSDSSFKSQPESGKEKTPYPNPLKLNRNSNINFYINNIDLNGSYELTILSTNMDVLFSKIMIPALNTNNEWIIRFDFKKDIDIKLNSGVYFYVLSKNDEIQKGKFVILNE